MIHEINPAAYVQMVEQQEEQDQIETNMAVEHEVSVEVVRAGKVVQAVKGN